MAAQKDIKFIWTKKGQLRAYYWVMRQFRWFPIGAVEAQKLIKADDARDVTANPAFNSYSIGQVHK